MNKETKKTYTDEEEEQARQLLKNPRLLDEFLRTCHSRYLKRDKELTLVKLATVSRKFDRGIAVIITGTASAGKSELMKTVMETVNDEDKNSYTRISKQFLFYRPEPLDHKVLFIHEMTGAEEAIYALRTGTSEGEINLGTVDPKAKNKAIDIKKSSKGLVLLTTTTRFTVEREFSTRLVITELTSDPGLTAEVFRQKVKPLAQTGFIPFEIWRIADHLIEPKRVILPYGEALAELFPKSEERYQRDFEKILTLIGASALLHQFQRDEDGEGNLVASLEDYRNVYELRDLLTQGISAVPQRLIDFLKNVKALERNGRFPTKEEIMTAHKISKATFDRYINVLGGMGLIKATGRGKTKQIEVLEIPEEFDSFLPKPEALLKDSERLGGSLDIDQLINEYLRQNDSMTHDGSQGSEPNNPTKYKGLFTMTQ